MKTNIHFVSYLAQFFLEREMLQKKNWREIQNTFYDRIFFFRKSCRLWDNVEKYSRACWPHIREYRMRIARWIPKDTDTHSECVILIAFPLQQWFHESASLLRCSTLITMCIDSQTLLTVCSCYIPSVWAPLIFRRQKPERSIQSVLLERFVWGLKMANSYSRNMLPSYCVLYVTIYVVFDCLYKT
jgi:hypothetical protein